MQNKKKLGKSCTFLWRSIFLQLPQTTADKATNLFNDKEIEKKVSTDG